MRRVHCLFLSGFALAGLCFATSASAQVFSGTAGVKGFAGGNVWTKPTDIPGSYDGHGFAGSGGGFGWGAGVYFEARFIKFLGLETGLTYDKSTLFRDVSISVASAPGVRVDTREKLDMTSLRVPLLFKGILPIPFGRISAFLGPEFIIPQSVSGGVEKTGGNADIKDIDSLMVAKKQSSTMLTMGIGTTIELPFSLEIPLELRASKNLSQGAAWGDRVSFATPQYGPPRTVKGQSSWDFRLGVGVGYRF